MLQRPKNSETEEDILRLQREFLAQRTKPAATVERVSGKHGSCTHHAPETAPSQERDFKPTKDFIRIEAMDREISAIRHEPKKHKEKVKGEVLSMPETGIEEGNMEATMDRKDHHITSILSRIQEKSNVIMNQNLQPKRFAGGFPSAPVLNKDLFNSAHNSQAKRTKKSLFAMQFMSENKSIFGADSDGGASEVDLSQNTMIEPNVLDSEAEKETVVSEKRFRGKEESFKQEIHEENLKRMASMSESEILMEQERLKAMLDPKLLAYVLNRPKCTSCVNSHDKSSREKKETPTVKVIDDRQVGIEQESKMEDKDFNPYKEFSIDKDIVHMDKFEPEKVQWMKPPLNLETPKIKGSARFDFDGNLLPKDLQVAIDRGLYHHGEEPESPGYTLEELFKLTRVNFQQQRIIAVQTLGKIIEKSYAGDYVDDIEGGVILPLLDAGLPFIVRWAMDENRENLFKAAIFVCSRLLFVTPDQGHLDLIRCSDCGLAQASLATALARGSHKDHSQTDAEILKMDVVKGLLNMQILPRIRYILEVLQPTVLTAIDCLKILSRFIQHSSEVAYEVFKCPRLINTIFHQYVVLPSSTMSQTLGRDEDIAQLRLSAFHLVYQLCLSGKSIASKLWTTFNIQSVLTRNLNDAKMHLDDKYLVMLTVECLLTWRVLLTYGIEIQSIRDMHSFIVDFVKVLFLAKEKSQCLTELKSSCILFVSSIINCLSFPGAENEQTRKLSQSGRKHLTKGDWVIVISFRDLLHGFLKEELVRITQSNACPIDYRLLSSLFKYLEEFIEAAKRQTYTSAVDVLQMIEQIRQDLIEPWLRSCHFQEMLNNLRSCSLLTAKINDGQPINHCLPRHTYNVVDLDKDLLHEREEKLNMMTSAIKLIKVMTEKHKGQLALGKEVVTHVGVTQYLQEFLASLTAAQISGKYLPARIEHHMVYNLVKVFCLLDEVEFSSTMTSLYHLCGLKLFSLFQPIDNHLGFDLMSNFILKSNCMRDCADQRRDDLSSTGESTSHMDTIVDREADIASLSELDTMKTTYLRCCFGGQDKQLTDERNRYLGRGDLVDTFLASPIFGLSQPSDWMFKPIIDLYNQTYNTELKGQVISSLTKESIDAIASSLRFVLIFEKHRQAMFSLVPVATRLARLMCVFLVGSDAFLEDQIHGSLQSLLELYCQQSYASQIEFSSPVPGLTAFSDFYSSLLMQYSATSYGDPVFSNYILFPLQRRHHPKFRRALWSEHSDLLRVFSLPIAELRLSYNEFFEEPPINEELVILYSRSFFSPSLRQHWSPLFYAVAVHHISMYIFCVQADTKDPDLISVSKQRLEMLDSVVNLKDETKRSDVLYYDKPNAANPRGFDIHSRLPPMRELLIMNRKY